MAVDCLDYDFYGEGDCSSARELKVFPFLVAVRLGHRLVRQQLSIHAMFLGEPKRSLDAVRLWTRCRRSVVVDCIMPVDSDSTGVLYHEDFHDCRH